MQSIDILFFIYVGVILVLLLCTRENRDSAVPMVVAPIICNLINFTYVKAIFSSNLIEGIILEVVAIVLSVVIVKLIDWITAISANILTIIFEIVASVGLIYIFYNIKVIMEFLMNLIH